MHPYLQKIPGLNTFLGITRILTNLPDRGSCVWLVSWYHEIMRIWVHSVHSVRLLFGGKPSTGVSSNYPWITTELPALTLQLPAWMALFSFKVRHYLYEVDLTQVTASNLKQYHRNRPRLKFNYLILLYLGTNPDSTNNQLEDKFLTYFFNSASTGLATDTLWA